MAVGDITASLAMTSRVLPILSLPSLPHALSDRSQLWKLHVHVHVHLGIHVAALLCLVSLTELACTCACVLLAKQCVMVCCAVLCSFP